MGSAPDRLLVGLCAILLLTGLGSNSLQNEDEARYALVQAHVLESGNWIDFEVQGAPWFNKAPLRVWASAALGAVFGVNEWTVRLPSALAAIGAVMALLWAGRSLLDVRTARWAALVLLTSTQFLYHHCGRTGEMDSALVMLWILAAGCAAKTRDDTRWWIAALACAALAGMTKHAFYVVPVAGVAWVTTWAVGTWRTIPARVWAAGLAVFAVILVPWHALMIARHGAVFVDTYLGREVGGRVAEHVDGAHPALFYPGVIEDGLFPWSLLLPFALWGAARAMDRRVLVLLAVWAVPMIVGPWIARFDLAWYTVPALPALALVVGRWLAHTSAPRWAMLAAGVLLLLSPSNVMHFDALDTRAAEGMIGVQAIGLLRGADPWAIQLAAGIFVVLAPLRLWRAPERARRGWILRAWALFAIAHAAVPLRDAWEPSTLDVLVQRVDARAMADDPVVALAPEMEFPSDLYGFALRRLDRPELTTMADPDALPANAREAWILGPTATIERLGEPAPDLRFEGWSALAPVVPRSVPHGVVPRDPED